MKMQCPFVKARCHLLQCWCKMRDWFPVTFISVGICLNSWIQSWFFSRFSAQLPRSGQDHPWRDGTGEKLPKQKWNRDPPCVAGLELGCCGALGLDADLHFAFRGCPARNHPVNSHARFLSFGDVVWKQRGKKKTTKKEPFGNNWITLKKWGGGKKKRWKSLLLSGCSVQFCADHPTPAVQGSGSQSRWRLVGEMGMGMAFLLLALVWFSFPFPIVSLMFPFVIVFIKKLTLCICAITTCHDDGQTFVMPRLLTQHKMNSNRKWCTFSWERWLFFLLFLTR